MVLYTLGDVNKLTLHLPARWETNKYFEKVNASKSSWKSPGQSANELHKRFSKAIGEDTLGHIETAFVMGAKRFVYDGFQQRNTEVAKSPFLVAFTWGEGSEPKKGGTLDTWQKCAGRKVHIPLQSLEDTKPILPRKTERDFSDDDIECDGPKRAKLETGEQK